MKELEINDKTFVFGKLNVFDQQYVLGKLGKVLTDFAKVLKEEDSQEKAFFVLQEGFSNLGRETFKEVSTLLLSKVQYKQKATDGVSSALTNIITTGGEFQYDWIGHDIMLFQSLLVHAFSANFDSFLVTKGN